MASRSPAFEVVGDPHLSDSAIAALAALLLETVDRARENEEPYTSGLATASAIEACDECTEHPRGGP
jgi:hypothetical protein